MDINALAPLVMPWLIRFIPPLFDAAKSYGEKALDTVAEKALEKVGENITDETWKFGKPLLMKLLPRLLAKPAALEAAEDIAKAPDNPTYQTVLQVQLTKILEADQELRAEVKHMVEEAQQFGIKINITASGNRNVAAQNINAPVFTGDIKDVHINQSIPAALFKPGSAPPLPPLIIGRSEAINDLKARLGVVAGQSSPTIQVLTAVRGWPGVGKTTLAAALAHDPETSAAFPDGVLWASLGQNPELLSKLVAWGHALGVDDLLRLDNLEEVSARLAAILLNKRMFLIIDDVWETEHAMPFKIGGKGCATLITTRITSVAQAVAPTAKDVYWLGVLSNEDSLKLLQELAPEVVVHYPDRSLELAHELEGLPLALQVAGHLLNAEARTGWGVTELLLELREGAKLLNEKAPADYTEIETQTIPTVAVLLQKSTDHLDKHARDCFAYLGAFAPKPATFDLAAMKAVWEIGDPMPITRILVDRGLLEPVGSGRFQMHALLVTHARSLLTWE